MVRPHLGEKLEERAKILDPGGAARSRSEMGWGGGGDGRGGQGGGLLMTPVNDEQAEGQAGEEEHSNVSSCIPSSPHSHSEGFDGFKLGVTTLTKKAARQPSSWVCSSA